MPTSSLVTLALLVLAFVQDGHSLAVKPKVDLNKCRVADCGQTDPNFVRPRIVGGRKAKVGELPFHVGIWKHEYHYYMICSGNMINDRWIITTAQCFMHFLARPTKNLRGSVAILDVNEKHQNEVAFEKIVIHPQFNSSASANNIALIKTAKSINSSSSYYVNPICLPFDDLDTSDDEVFTIAGFGAIHQSKLPQDYLYLTTIKRIADPLCSKQYTVFNSTQMICAGDLNGGHDNCIGDAGGPLASKSANGSYILKGLVSHGLGCGLPNVPQTYTKVAHYLDWICETMLDNGVD